VPVQETVPGAGPIWHIAAVSKIGARQGGEAASDDSGSNTWHPWLGRCSQDVGSHGPETHAHRSPTPVSRKLWGSPARMRATTKG